MRNRILYRSGRGEGNDLRDNDSNGYELYESLGFWQDGEASITLYEGDLTTPASDAITGVNLRYRRGIAILFGLIIRFTPPGTFGEGFYFITSVIVLVNLALGVFNLIPIPPLDGSKVLEALLPRSLQYGYQQWRGNLERNPLLGMGVVLLIVFLLGNVWGNLIYALASAIAGV